MLVLLPQLRLFLEQSIPFLFHCLVFQFRHICGQIRKGRWDSAFLLADLIFILPFQIFRFHPLIAQLFQFQSALHQQFLLLSFIELLSLFKVLFFTLQLFLFFPVCHFLFCQLLLGRCQLLFLSFQALVLSSKLGLNLLQFLAFLFILLFPLLVGLFPCRKNALHLFQILFGSRSLRLWNSHCFLHFHQPLLFFFYHQESPVLGTGTVCAGTTGSSSFLGSWVSSKSGSFVSDSSTCSVWGHSFPGRVVRERPRQRLPQAARTMLAVSNIFFVSSWIRTPF